MKPAHRSPSRRPRSLSLGVHSTLPQRLPGSTPRKAGRTRERTGHPVGLGGHCHHRGAGVSAEAVVSRSGGSRHEPGALSSGNPRAWRECWLCRAGGTRLVPRGRNAVPAATQRWGLRVPSPTGPSAPQSPLGPGRARRGPPAERRRCRWLLSPRFLPQESRALKLPCWCLCQTQTVRVTNLLFECRVQTEDSLSVVLRGSEQPLLHRAVAGAEPLRPWWEGRGRSQEESSPAGGAQRP